MVEFENKKNVPNHEVWVYTRPYIFDSHNEETIVPLKRSLRQRLPGIRDDFIVYLQESDFNIRPKVDPSSFSQAMNGDSSRFVV